MSSRDSHAAKPLQLPPDLAARRAITIAKRKLDGAMYDLTRQDKHPNDLHKAASKLSDAMGACAEAIRNLEHG